MYCIEMWIKLHFETLKSVASKTLVFDMRVVSSHGLLMNRMTVQLDNPERQLPERPMRMADVPGSGPAWRLLAPIAVIGAQAEITELQTLASFRCSHLNSSMSKRSYLIGVARFGPQ